jgi:alkanesulfonate monooxygenase SsuD/methylene tetrahydromethanopterin reductase-like flavin-dependent oxidoreductase (luciferase family)
VGRIADGWISASRAPLHRVGEMVRVIGDAAEQAGRDPASLRFVCRGAVRLREPATGVAASDERPMLTGTVEQIGEDLARLAAQGISETFLDLNFDPEVTAPGADAARSMDQARRLLEAFAPHREG